ncbi:hypothetical protein K3495_g4594 [Podosphaera aphanis]|nr:hypothetical protein K3495_g4594 [Podosphaera aphanis]
MYSIHFTRFLVAASASSALASYTLNPEDTYEGNTFFDKFNFYTGTDPTQGFVQYSDQTTASNSKLISINQGQQAYIGVDSTNTYDVNSHGRPSVRLETKKTYQYGLFVLDLAHMPSNTCGSWPAFWTTNDQDWPRWGEIDILENIHESPHSLEALHTVAGCSVTGNKLNNQMLGNQYTYNCDGSATTNQFGSQGLGQGCAAENTNPNNYGSEFNAVGGGVYAMEWTKQAISIWHFSRNVIPQDLASGTPNPSGWGQPVFTSAQGSCDIDGHFKDQKIILDHTFCGNWAGQDQLWQQTSCYKSNPTQYATCSSYVAANPAAYKESYWLVNSLKIYQDKTANPVATSQLSLASSATEFGSSANTVPIGQGRTVMSDPLTSDSSDSSAYTTDSGNDTTPATPDFSLPSGTSTSASPASAPSISETCLPLSQVNSSLTHPNSFSISAPLQSATASAASTGLGNFSNQTTIATKTFVPVSPSDIKTSTPHSAIATKTFVPVSPSDIKTSTPHSTGTYKLASRGFKTRVNNGGLLGFIAALAVRALF